MRIVIASSVFSFAPHRLWIDLNWLNGFSLGIDLCRESAYFTNMTKRVKGESFSWNGPNYNVGCHTYTLSLNLLKWRLSINLTRYKSHLC